MEKIKEVLLDNNIKYNETFQDEIVTSLEAQKDGLSIFVKKTNKIYEVLFEFTEEKNSFKEFFLLICKTAYLHNTEKDSKYFSFKTLNAEAAADTLDILISY